MTSFKLPYKELYAVSGDGTCVWCNQKWYELESRTVYDSPRLDLYDITRVGGRELSYHEACHFLDIPICDQLPEDRAPYYRTNDGDIWCDQFWYSNDPAHCGTSKLNKSNVQEPKVAYKEAFRSLKGKIPLYYLKSTQSDKYYIECDEHGNITRVDSDGGRSPIRYSGIPGFAGIVAAVNAKMLEFITEEEAIKIVPKKIQIAGYDVKIADRELCVGCQKWPLKDANHYLKVVKLALENNMTLEDIETLETFLKEKI